MDRDGVVQWLIGDHLGTTSLVLDDQRSKIAESRHYPYGEERWRWPQEGTFPTDYRFTGQRMQSGLGLYHMGARNYDPALGRWISADTLVPDPANPQSFNRYSWVLGNPLRFVDPTGHFTEEELIEWGAYTEEELKWLAENQANWYNYLMQAVLGDAFMFARLWAGGVGQFLLDDSDKLFIGGAFWTEEIGFQTGGSVQAWGNAIGQATIQEGFLAPEERLFPNAPNPHVQLSPKAEKVHAEIVMGIDIAATLVTDVGYLIALIDTLALPMDPAGKAFGFF